MAVLLAALAAATFGTGDFLGGLSARRLTAVLTMVLVQVSGLAAVSIVALTVAGEPTGADVAFGALAGASGAIAFILFYWSMTNAAMSIVAPISAVLAATVPVVVGFVAGERPPAWAWAGMAIAIPSILLISREPGPVETVGEDLPRGSAAVGGVRVRVPAGSSAPPVVAAALAGIGFGMVVVFLSRTGTASGLWPLVPARTTAAAIGVLAALVVRPGLPRGRGVGIALAAGLLDAAGNSLYLLATREGLLSLVGVIGALYPASTVLLARYVLSERLSPHQRVGLVAALVAVVLIAAA